MNQNIRTDVVSIPTNNTNALEFPLGDIGQIKNAKRIISIEAFKVGDVAVGPGNLANVNDTVFNKAFLVLVDSQDVTWAKTPLYSLRKANNAGNVPVLDLPQMDSQKSKIVIANTINLSAVEAFILAITYEK